MTIVLFGKWRSFLFKDRVNLCDFTKLFDFKPIRKFLNKMKLMKIYQGVICMDLIRGEFV